MGWALTFLIVALIAAVLGFGGIAGVAGSAFTMIGSTANIVALGMLEKRYRIRIHFFEWFRVGLAAGLIASVVAWMVLSVTGPLMTGQG